MNVAIRNARRLANDARTLLDLERYPTAASIAVLSIEESGKVSILRHSAMARDLPGCRKIWRDNRNHQSKNFAWYCPIWSQEVRGTWNPCDLQRSPMRNTPPS